jgi:GNAT superfamily N-acetyltransferase
MVAATPVDEIHATEELFLSAWPALQTAFYDGWVLRFGAGFTRRSNSINPLYGSTLDPAQKIAHCADWFRARGLRPVFKLTDAAQPSALDALLDQQGYIAEGHTSVQRLKLVHFAAGDLGQVQVSPTAPEGWVAACVSFNAFDPKHSLTLRRILDNLVLDAAFAAIRQGDVIVAVGLAVATQGHVCLFDIATAPDHRNQGLGRAVVSALLHWGQSQGAVQALLQVVPQNAPATHLYARLGFGEIYQYWYRAR